MSPQPRPSDAVIGAEFKELFTQYTFEAAEVQIQTGRPVNPEEGVNRVGAVLMQKYGLSAPEVARIVEKAFK
jgi:hypothetical protein